MAIGIDKHRLAFEIMKITFQMEDMIKQTPNSLLHEMNNNEYVRYTDLLKRKSAMIDELQKLMLNDGDL
ncbi:unnamed protein product [Rotaria sordida]|uniref:Uncharacterized protein n=1 Tax=Rotaria sordida TaxID=392033 RepID=A0A815BGC4_9BILA|nr:unnamed protein product [Rotaria sordida]CAF1267183.1 unnamed protein product [Rotaria sordida]CAF1354503.1 unnamed protein product [Rotaria sordida]